MFEYSLPPELIAKEPAQPRDSSRLLVVDTKKGLITDRVFYELPDIVPPSLFVLNSTKVVPARSHLIRKTGGKVEVFFLVNELFGKENKQGQGGLLVRGMVNKGLHQAEVLTFPSGEEVYVVGQQESVFTFNFSQGFHEFISLLEREGETPLPPYLGKEVLQNEAELRNRYQTVFAQTAGSVAAPTASLHFTEEVLGILQDRGSSFAHISLHVGRGTFAPLTEAQIQEKKLHKEWYEIESRVGDVVHQAKRSGLPICCVGTTAMRAMESWAFDPQKLSGETDIFITHPHNFSVADMMITNFHLPGTSLLHLVDAFLRHKGSKIQIEEIYQHAIKEHYRFYSFGDAMIIL